MAAASMAEGGTSGETVSKGEALPALKDWRSVLRPSSSIAESKGTGSSAESGKTSAGNTGPVMDSKGAIDSDNINAYVQEPQQRIPMA